jgi:hypothetical protein
MYVYPENNEPLTLTKATGTWNGFDAKTEIMAAGILTKDIVLKGILITNIDEIGNYQIAFYKGAEGSEELMGVCPFSFTTKKDTSLSGDGGCTIKAGTRLSASLVRSMFAAGNISLYIEYDFLYS